MTKVVVTFEVEDDQADEMVAWAQELLHNEHPWLPGVFFARVQGIEVGKEVTVR